MLIINPSSVWQQFSFVVSDVVFFIVWGWSIGFSLLVLLDSFVCFDGFSSFKKWYFFLFVDIYSMIIVIKGTSLMTYDRSKYCDRIFMVDTFKFRTCIITEKRIAQYNHMIENDRISRLVKLSIIDRVKQHCSTWFVHVSVNFVTGTKLFWYFT